MPFFKLKCEALHPIHCLKQMFITFFHTLKRNLEWIPDLTTLTNLRRFQILLFPPKRYLSLQSWGAKKLKKGKISTVHFKVNNFLQGTPWLEDSQLSTEIPSTMFGSILPYSNQVAVQHYLDRTVLPKLLVSSPNKHLLQGSSLRLNWNQSLKHIIRDIHSTHTALITVK